MVVLMTLISLVVFWVIQLPPGDYASTLMARMEETGMVESAYIERVRVRYGLDQPIHVQYFRWINNIVVRGDFGYSFEWNRPVSELIWNRLGMSVLVAGTALVFTLLVSFPVGVYSAVKQYSIGDYIATIFGFLGLAVPNFLIALVLMWISFQYFGWNVGGLFSYEFVRAPWSFARLLDFLRHVWIPMIVIGTAGTAALIRITRANLLDELNKPYVEAARARGMKEKRLIVKYPVRIALNPFISTAGWLLPTMISGEVIVATVLDLPTIGPRLLQALLSQDMYLAGGILLLVSILTLIGTLLSDIALAWADPRIRYE